MTEQQFRASVNAEIRRVMAKIEEQCSVCAGLGAVDNTAEWYVQRCWACGGSGWRTFQINADGTESWI